MMKKLFLSCLALTVILYACKEKEETKPDTDNGTSEDVAMKRIIAHQWKIYKVEVAGSDIFNNPFLVKSCQRDDTYRFYKDSSLLRYENAEICDGGSDSSKSSWKFYDGRKKVIATIFTITDTADVTSLEDSTMMLTVDYMDQPTKIYFRKK